MEPIDTAYEKFCLLSSKMKTDVYWSSIQTESDTRLKIIDRFFIEILGWTHGEIQTEEHTGKGYLDYKLSINNASRVIVEAKRLSRDFDLNSPGKGNYYKLNGPVFNNKASGGWQNRQHGIERRGTGQNRQSFVISKLRHSTARTSCITKYRRFRRI